MALFGRDLFTAVVLFEQKHGRGYSGIATGFVVGFKTRRKRDTYHTFIVTNHHVVKDKTSITLSFDTLGEKRKRLEVPLVNEDGKKAWISHKNPKVDLVLLPVSMSFLKTKGISTKFIPDSQFLYIRDFEKTGLELGDGVFFAGFPLGITGKLRNFPLLRSGVISRADKELVRLEKAYIVDGQNFPGNSGGPVFTRPELAKLEGTKNIDKCLLVGVIKGYLPSRQTYVDPFTGQIGAISVENSGLALVVPMDFAKQIYNVWAKTNSNKRN